MLSCPNQIHSTPIILTINMIFNLTTTLLHPLPPTSKNTTFPYPSIIKPYFPRPQTLGAANLQINHPNTEPHSSNFLSNLFSLAIAVTTLTSPLSCLALPSLKSPPSLLPPTTPFSQSKNLATGLDNGKIRACPSINPGCISTNPMSASFTFPWTIPDTASQNAIQQLQQAIMETQKNAKIQVVEDTPDGQYLQAEVDGGFGRDVLEFLVKGDVVVYRCMATKVTYVYPFTTALGDSKGQEERMGKIVNKLGWYAPSLTSME